MYTYCSSNRIKLLVGACQDVQPLNNTSMPLSISKLRQKIKQEHIQYTILLHQIMKAYKLVKKLLLFLNSA